MSIFVSQGSSSKSSRRCWFVLSTYVYVHVDVGACVCWCCRGVARVSQAFVQLWVMWSCISIPAFVWPCSPCSPADQRPSSYLSCSLNCDHNAVTSWPFPTTGKLIVLLPSHSPPVIQPISKQQGCFSWTKEKHSASHKHTPLTQWYQWQLGTLQTHMLLS